MAWLMRRRPCIPSVRPSVARPSVRPSQGAGGPRVRGRAPAEVGCGRVAAAPNGYLTLNRVEYDQRIKIRDCLILAPDIEAIEVNQLLSQHAEIFLPGSAIVPLAKVRVLAIASK